MLAVGARVLFYISNKKPGPQIIAKAEISSISNPRSGGTDPDAEAAIHSILEFKDIERLDAPVDFKVALETLSFAPKNMKKWGVVVLGGCRYISDEDYKKILSFSP